MIFNKKKNSSNFDDFTDDDIDYLDDIKEEKYPKKDSNDEDDDDYFNENLDFSDNNDFIGGDSSSTMEKHNDLLKELTDFLTQNGTIPFNDVIAFNNSTGGHVHLSKHDHAFNNEFEEILLKMRKDFFKGIRKSDLNKKAKRDILKNYFRSYAREYDPENRYRRECEFNFYSEQQGNGFEWRSPNLNGIKRDIKEDEKR